MLQQSMADLRQQQAAAAAANSALHQQHGDQSSDSGSTTNRERLDSTELINNKSDQCEYCGKVKYTEAMTCNRFIFVYRVDRSCFQFDI